MHTCTHVAARLANSKPGPSVHSTSSEWPQAEPYGYVRLKIYQAAGCLPMFAPSDAAYGAAKMFVALGREL